MSFSSTSSLAKVCSSSSAVDICSPYPQCTSTQCSQRAFPVLLPVTSKLSNQTFCNSLNSRGMMSAIHSNSNTEAMTSFPVFNTSASSAPRTQRGSDFPLEVTVEHIVEVHTGSQASHEKESDLSDDRFVLSQAVFDSEKRKESV